MKKALFVSLLVVVVVVSACAGTNTSTVTPTPFIPRPTRTPVPDNVQHYVSFSLDRHWMICPATFQALYGETVLYEKSLEVRFDSKSSFWGLLFDRGRDPWANQWHNEVWDFRTGARSVLENRGYVVDKIVLKDEDDYPFPSEPACPDKWIVEFDVVVHDAMIWTPTPVPNAEVVATWMVDTTSCFGLQDVGEYIYTSMQPVISAGNNTIIISFPGEYYTYNTGPWGGLEGPFPGGRILIVSTEMCYSVDILPGEYLLR